jgi:hypothetical protein
MDIQASLRVKVAGLFYWVQDSAVWLTIAATEGIVMAIPDTVPAVATGRKSGIGSGAPVSLTSLVIACKRGVLLVPAPSNTGNLYVGGPNVTANTSDATDGCLVPASGFLAPVGNTNMVNLIADAAGQAVFWAAM